MFTIDLFKINGFPQTKSCTYVSTIDLFKRNGSSPTNKELYICVYNGPLQVSTMDLFKINGSSPIKKVYLYIECSFKTKGSSQQTKVYV